MFGPQQLAPMQTGVTPSQIDMTTIMNLMLMMMVMVMMIKMMTQATKSI